MNFLLTYILLTQFPKPPPLFYVNCPNYQYIVNFCISDTISWVWVLTVNTRYAIIAVQTFAERRQNPT